MPKCSILTDFSTSQASKNFSMGRANKFWVFKMLSEIRGMQRILNHDRATNETFLFDKLLPPPFRHSLDAASLHITVEDSDTPHQKNGNPFTSKLCRKVKKHPKLMKTIF